MLFRQLFDHDTWTYTYLIADPTSGEAALIDPVAGQVERDLGLLVELGLTLKYSMETHVHADHITGSGELRARTNAQTVVSSQAGVDCADIGLQHGGTLSVGDIAIEARHTPGHTGTCVSYIVRHGSEVIAFTGDALFVRGCGRTDFQQGDARQLYRSVHEQLYSLPDTATIYPGHDYKGHRCSTIGEEKRHNPRLRLSVTEDAFVQLMGDLQLAKPRFIDVALPANLACGTKAAQPDRGS